MTTATKEPQRIIGETTCPYCAKPIKIKISKKNKLYGNCTEPSGGCGAQIFSRSATADKHLARRITKWVDPNERRAYLGEEALPAKAKPPAPKPLPISQPDPEPESEPDPEPEEIEEAEPTPTPPPPAKPKRPVPAQFQKAAPKPFWDL